MSRKLISGNTSKLVAAQLLLSAWGRSERIELQRECRGHKRRASFNQGVAGVECDDVSVNDVELIGQLLVEIRDCLSVDAYTVLVLLYRHDMRLADVVGKVGFGKGRVQTLKTSGEYYVAARI